MRLDQYENGCDLYDYRYGWRVLSLTSRRPRGCSMERGVPHRQPLVRANDSGRSLCGRHGETPPGGGMAMNPSSFSLMCSRLKMRQIALLAHLDEERCVLRAAV